ncbi:MAG: putative rane protein [Ramlibacter sp.]|nr:putative rane protein [Ramlibacter sp.]
MAPRSRRRRPMQTSDATSTTAPRSWFRAFWPAPVSVDARERWRASAGAAIGILFTALVSRWVAGASGSALWMVAPMGASAVLVFCMPASPVAQPWAVVGGNVLSALVGIACYRWIGDPVLAATAAVGLAIALMFATRCLHPPGGAMALLAVLSHADRFEVAFFPVLANALLLALAGIVYNSSTNRRYPHAQLPARAPAGPAGSRFSHADFDAALAHYNQVLDVPRDDLERLLQDAEMAAYQRNLGEIRCADIMTPDPLSIEFGTPLDEAWERMHSRGIKALPVVDRARRVVGIITLADFMRHAGVDTHHRIGQRLRELVRPSGSVHSDKPEVAGQIMSRKVRVASQDRQVVELVPLFSEGGHHHIPIIDAERRLVGIITQSDLVRSLYRAVRGDAAPA